MQNISDLRKEQLESEKAKREKFKTELEKKLSNLEDLRSRMSVETLKFITSSSKEARNKRKKGS